MVMSHIGTTINATYTVDASKKPKHMDFFVLGHKSECIYELTEDGLKLALSQNGQARLTAFRPDPNSKGWITFILKRDKAERADKAEKPKQSQADVKGQKLLVTSNRTGTSPLFLIDPEPDHEKVVSGSPLAGIVHRSAAGGLKHVHGKTGASPRPE
jgi:hypothetical protein